MKSLSLECNVTSWSMVIYSDTLHESYITLPRDTVTELDLVTEFEIYTKMFQ